MPLLRNTLRKRLILISLLTTGTALLFASSALFLSQLLSLRNSIVRDISIKADITGSQCTAALVFNTPKDAEEILGALRADPHIVLAAVYASDGSLFSLYRRVNSAERPPFSPATDGGYRFDLSHLDLVHPIVLREERIGTIFIRSDLRNLHVLLLRSVIVAGIVLAASLLAAYALMSRLQRTITAPVGDLVQLMEGISRSGDFSRRAAQSGPDELCSLARGFNDMLTTIQDRDGKLEQQHRDLENSIARLRKSTEELEGANKKLKTLDKLKSDFISVVSHELRTPLTAIKAFVELLMIKRNMPPEKKLKLLQTINDESDRLGRLINDLLDLTRIEAGTMNWRRQEVSIDEVIQVAVDMLLPTAQRRGVRLSAALEPSLPRFHGDRDRLVQVAANILSNAVKFTPEGGEINVMARLENLPRRHLVIAITDTGTGIPAEEIELIFDKFHRAGDVLTASVEGTGLGLAIARQIVEHHGGKIWAASEYGAGSTFTFTIPLDVAQETAIE
jgi:signal transduction histidine kinase